jgi:formate hydrogenlyase subunit 4
MSTTSVVLGLAQVLLVVVVAPLLVGVMRWVRARLEGRAGASIWQPWRDARKLFRKERIRPVHTSWVFALAPLVIVASTLVVVAACPLIATQATLGPVGDLFLVVYLLLLGTVALALAGLDPGTAFGGMGASRAMTVAALAEPAILLAVFSLSVPARSSNLGTIVRATIAAPERSVSPANLLALVAFLVVTLAEAGRLPVDNPGTHLELTMIHEAMVLEYAGPDLALVEFGAAMRLTVLLGLVSTLFIPFGIATSVSAGALAVGVAAILAKITALAVGLAVFEVFTAKLRLFRVPELLSVAFVLAFLAVVVSFFLS